MIRKLLFVLLGVLVLSSVSTWQIWEAGAMEGSAQRETEPESISPDRIEVTLEPGEVHTETVDVTTGDNPIDKGDVMFVFDLTASMDGELAAARSSAMQIMNDVASELPNTWFGVASFMDYPGDYSYPGYSGTYGTDDDVPWELNADPTGNIGTIDGVFNGLELGSGADGPESYSRMLYELNHSVNWRSDSKKIAVVFGDAPTHDLNFAGYNYGGDPGRDAVAQTADDLDFETVVRDLNQSGISILAVYTTSNVDGGIETFRGMSEGYATAVGTNGTYFELSNTSDLPEATVDLILSETLVIDRLSLQVTEGYDSWVQVTPAYYEGVGPNTKKSFTVQLSPPEGTEPGVYTFALRADGDGNILGLTSVTITVPPDYMDIDLGFRPSKDGFRFSNTGAIPTMTWPMFSQYFGADAVYYENGDRVYAAQALFDKNGFETPDGNARGDCDGFTATAGLNYFDLGQPNAGQYAMQHYDRLFRQKKNDNMEDAIAFNQAIQRISLERMRHLGSLADSVDNSPAEMYRYAKEMISNGVPVIGLIAWVEDVCAPGSSDSECVKARGHSLFPYRFEEAGSNLAYLYVYDPNDPGDDERRIEIRRAADTWSYEWPVSSSETVTLTGDDSFTSIGFVPLEIYRHQGLPLWKRPHGSVELDTLDITAAHRVIDATGRLEMLFVDREGRRLGFDDGKFYDEIPGAFYIPALEMEFTNGSYFIPKDLDVEISFVAGDADIGGLQIYDDGSLIDIALEDITPGARAVLDPGSGGEGVSIGVQEGSIGAGIAINRQIPGEDETISISGGNIVDGEHIGVVIDDSGGTSPIDDVVISGDIVYEKPLDFTIFRSGGAGYSVFGTDDIVVDRDFEARIGVPDWSNIGDLDMEVDWGQDGTVDETQILINDATPSNIEIQTGETVLAGLGQTAQLIIGVRNQYGSYVQNGTEVTFEISSGEITTPVSVTSGGLVYAGFTPGSFGTSTVVVRAGDAVTSIDIYTDRVFQAHFPMLFNAYEYTPPPPNRRPNTPSDPSPTSGAMNRTIDVNLFWSGGDPDGDRVTYDVKLETGDSTPDQVICAGSGSTFCDPGTLREGVKYYWQVTATDEHGARRVGPVWEFTTATGNLPPDTPGNPTPGNGATEQDLNVDLYWSGGDPDGDSVTYVVRFEAGNNTPENEICPDTSSTFCDPGTLEEDTTYYWQVVATDGPGSETAGPIWRFTTRGGPIPDGTWQPVGSGAASGGGISANGGDSGYPLIAVSPTDSRPVVAWHDNSAGNYEIYVKKWNGSSWQALGGSAGGGGISLNGGSSQYPYVAVAPDGTPYVVWVDQSSGKYQIYLKYWNGSSWQALGGSASGGGLSNSSSSARSPSITIGPDGRPYVGYRDNSSGNYEIYLKVWNGSSWQALGGSASGGGISQNSGFSGRALMTVDASGKVCVSWQDASGGDWEIYLKCWNGSSWQALGGSASGGGISNNGGDSMHNTMALDTSGRPIVAWQDASAGDNEIYLKRWNGSSWQAVGGSASGGGISNNGGDSVQPAIAVDSGDRIHVTWRDMNGSNMEIYSKYWNGSSWVEHQAGSASGGGISQNAGASEWPPLAIGPDNVPYVTWMDNSSGDYEIYVKRWQ